MQIRKRVKSYKSAREFWLSDQDKNQALSLRYTGNLLFEKNSRFQNIKVIDTYAYGKSLIIDNMIMCTEKDEKHYHEMISHPAILAHGKIKNVLVIGGGDGATVREVLKHENIKKVILVEIDENVVEASKLHLPSLSCSFNHPKLELVIEDGVKYIKNITTESYDLIIVDSYDPVGPAKRLFSVDFLRHCRQALTSNGLLVTQGESPFFGQTTFVSLSKCLKKIFGEKKVKTLLFHIPTYPTGVWCFYVASKGKINPAKVNSKKIALFEQNNELDYYNHEVHKAAFALPNYMKKLLDE